MSYESALAFTLGIEQDWYPGNLASDPHPTMKGVRQDIYDTFRDGKRLPRQSVRAIADSELQEIYFTYWTGAHCSQVGPLAAVVLFDHSVNAGPAAAVRVLQLATGVEPDGVFGPKTLAAIGTVLNDQALALRCLWGRLEDYHRIAASPVKRPNLESWLGRVLECRKALGLTI